MVQVKPKTTVQMKMTGTGQTHGRTQVRARDVTGIVDEPAERGGSNLAPTPTETLMASLMGCTNVIAKRIAHGMGVQMGEMKIELSADFDRRGTMLLHEVDRPFDNIVLDIAVATDATPEQIEAIKSDLAKFCPIAKVIRGNGATITENWTTTPL